MSACAAQDYRLISNLCFDPFRVRLPSLLIFSRLDARAERERPEPLMLKFDSSSWVTISADLVRLCTWMETGTIGSKTWGQRRFSIAYTS